VEEKSRPLGGAITGCDTGFDTGFDTPPKMAVDVGKHHDQGVLAVLTPPTLPTPQKSLFFLNFP
jgi:hypothetical protein